MFKYLNVRNLNIQLFFFLCNFLSKIINRTQVIKYNISGWTALNLKDFYKWSEAINSFKIISYESTLELFNPFSEGSQTGLGEGSIQHGHVINHIHDGTAFNYQALLISNPDFTIILMTNNKQNNLKAISDSIKSILEGKPYNQIEKKI